MSSAWHMTVRRGDQVRVKKSNPHWAGVVADVLDVSVHGAQLALYDRQPDVVKYEQSFWEWSELEPVQEQQ